MCNYSNKTWSSEDHPQSFPPLARLERHWFMQPVARSCVHLPPEILSCTKAGTKAWFTFQFANSLQTLDKSRTPNNCLGGEWMNVIEYIHKCSGSQNTLQKGWKIADKWKIVGSRHLPLCTSALGQWKWPALPVVPFQQTSLLAHLTASRRRSQDGMNLAVVMNQNLGRGNQISATAEYFRCFKSTRPSGSERLEANNLCQNPAKPSTKSYCLSLPFDWQIWK